MNLKGIRSTFKPDSPYRLFILSILFGGITLGIYRGVLDNYLAEMVGMGEMDRGITEFFRELPGVLMVLVFAVGYALSAEAMYKIGGAICLLGLVMHSVVPAMKVPVIAAMFVLSVGEHIQLGMKTALTLSYCSKGKEGKSQGVVSSSYQIGHLAGYLLVAGAFWVWNDNRLFSWLFRIAAVAFGVSMVYTWMMKGKSGQGTHNKRFHFDRKFNKYYMLEVFYGARKQVFLTFGPYVLILFYGADTSVVSLMYAVSAVATFLAAPAVGRIIDRIGYKAVMVADTLILVIVCFCYGFAHHFFPMRTAFIICCVNYILDAVISLASMASNVYVRDIADNEEEVRATLFTGLSVNHVISIFIALCGGWIWKTMGIEMLFVASAVLGLCNSAYAATIRKKPEDMNGEPDVKKA